VRAALSLRVHALLEHSCANGPGCRAVIWVQGCGIRCAGCCNPGAQDPDGGQVVPVAELVGWVRAIRDIEGLTLSGGEPLQQRQEVEALLRGVRTTSDLSVLLFTGHDWRRVHATPEFGEVVALCDVVVAGPYRREEPHGGGLRGSANQTIHLLTDRYSLADLEAVPQVEVVFDEDDAILTGVNDAILT
jgi:anaerobic ribonucleoside-triphosphate reductase activating protein